MATRRIGERNMNAAPQTKAFGVLLKSCAMKVSNGVSRSAEWVLDMSRMSSLLVKFLFVTVSMNSLFGIWNSTGKHSPRYWT